MSEVPLYLHLCAVARAVVLRDHRDHLPDRGAGFRIEGLGVRA